MRRGRDAADEHGGEVARLQAAEDVVAEARGADGGRERREADDPHRRRAHACDDDRQCERQLDAAQSLTISHADGARRLDDGGIDAGDAGHRIPQNR